MATKASPKQWYYYKIRVNEKLSARLQIVVGHVRETFAQSDGGARSHVRYRLARQLGESLGAFPDECMDILEKTPVHRRSHSSPPAPSLF